MSAALKPCPFCGRPAISLSEDNGCVGETCENSWRAYAGCNNEDCAIGVELYESGDYWCGDSENDDDPAPLLREECERRWNMRTAVGDPDFSMVIHDGDIWRKEQTCRNVDEGREFTCSKCGARYYILSQGEPTEPWAHVRRPGHCPNCGAKVVEQ